MLNNVFGENAVTWMGLVCIGAGVAVFVLLVMPMNTWMQIAFALNVLFAGAVMLWAGRR